MGIAHRWSKKSRLASTGHEEVSYGEKEHLLIYSKEQELIAHHDYYIFGHRHLTLDMEVSNNSRYLNPGDWVNNSNYIVFDGTACELKEFKV